MSLSRKHSYWQRADGACPACVQQALLETAVLEGREAFEGRIQNVWPLDAEAAFGAIPTPLRLRADPRFRGNGVSVALVDAGFFPHPDLIQPLNRIVAWVDASRDAVEARWFGRDDAPAWPDPVGTGLGGRWHGLMTSVTAAGNGWLSHGLYQGLAPDSDVVLVQVSDGQRITNDAIARALAWLKRHTSGLRLRVVSLSVAGEPVDPLAGSEVDEAVAALVAEGVVVVAAAGNSGIRQLVPPATAPEAVTVGGLDDRNTLSRREWQLWHSNYGSTSGGAPKPEVVAPSIWTVAPVLPGTEIALEAGRLFAARVRGASRNDERRIAELRLVTPYYQLVEGTSFAAPIVASIVACMWQANPQLVPRRAKELLMAAAVQVPGASEERQGAGAVDAGLAVAAALADRHSAEADYRQSPSIAPDTVRFLLHDHRARSVVVLGEWNGWRGPGLAAQPTEQGLWQATLPKPKVGRYAYKYLIDDSLWLPDPANPQRSVDDEGHVNSVLTVDQ